MQTVTPNSPVSTFNDQEIERLHSDDIHAGRAVVCLMAGVFTMGLLMYAVICWMVM